MDKAKPVALQLKAVGIEPAVAQHDVALLGRASTNALIASAGCADQGDRHRLRIDKIAEGCFQRLRGGDRFGDLNHAGSFTFCDPMIGSLRGEDNSGSLVSEHGADVREMLAAPEQLAIENKARHPKNADLLGGAADLVELRPPLPLQIC